MNSGRREVAEKGRRGYEGVVVVSKGKEKDEEDVER